MFQSYEVFNFVECAVGFYDTTCSSPCPYPTYGRHCQNMCNCTKDMCDIEQGCLKEIGNVYQLHKYFFF